MNFVGAASLIASLCPQNASGADIYSVELDSETIAIAIEGDISKGDGEIFRREAAKHEQATVLLESDGGSTVDAIEIGEAIRLRGFSTLVLNGSRCVSACGLIWLAGTPRALSQTARVGFHATYTDESGVLLESGLGNALVGRYFTLLNLPVKAIIFATKASPRELTWLDRSNYQATGIDVQFVEDLDQGTVAQTKPEQVTPPPIEVRTVQSRASTESWESISHWKVMVDRTLSDSCFVASQFTDGSGLRVGLDRKTGGRSYLLLANNAWSSLVVGDSHQMTLQFDDKSPWEANAKVVEFNGIKALSITFSDNEFWSEFALSHWLYIETGLRRVATLSLNQSRQALDSLIECQKYYNEQGNGRDPFAR
ncbi:MAG: hypothetical protein J7493_08410 [Porphyrobacter sp.]|nr:hypothetical protein [Porphyrobacter sp.]